MVPLGIVASGPEGVVRWPRPVGERGPLARGPGATSSAGSFTPAASGTAASSSWRRDEMSFWRFHCLADQRAADHPAQARRDLGQRDAGLLHPPPRSRSAFPQERRRQVSIW